MGAHGDVQSVDREQSSGVGGRVSSASTRNSSSERRANRISLFYQFLVTFCARMLLSIMWNKLSVYSSTWHNTRRSSSPLVTIEQGDSAPIAHRVSPRVAGDRTRWKRREWCHPKRFDNSVGWPAIVFEITN